MPDTRSYRRNERVVRYYAEVEVSSEMIHKTSIDVVRYAEQHLRDELRRRYGPEIAKRGRVVWRARLEVPALPSEESGDS